MVCNGMVWYVCMYVYIFAHKLTKKSFQLSLRNLFMLEIPSLAGFLVQGLRANLWGLVYCSGSSVSLSLSCFLLGFLAGVGFCAWLCFRFGLIPSLASYSTNWPCCFLCPSSYGPSWLLACPGTTATFWDCRPSGFRCWSFWFGWWLCAIHLCLPWSSTQVTWSFCGLFRGGWFWHSCSAFLWLRWTWDQRSLRCLFSCLPWAPSMPWCWAGWGCAVWFLSYRSGLDCWLLGACCAGQSGSLTEPRPSFRFALSVLLCGPCWLIAAPHHLPLFWLLLACHWATGEQLINFPKFLNESEARV